MNSHISKLLPNIPLTKENNAKGSFSGLLSFNIKRNRMILLLL